MKYVLAFLVALAGIFGFQAKRAKRKLENYKTADKEAGLTAQVKSWESSKNRKEEFNQAKKDIETTTHTDNPLKRKRVL